MINSFNRYFLSLILIGFVFIIMPISAYAEGINNTKTYIDNPVVDPNFNVMRENDTSNSTATFIVIGLLITATIIPLATWWYFSK